MHARGMMLPLNASLFTVDAKSMYTNTPTDMALPFIKNYLLESGINLVSPTI